MPVFSFDAVGTGWEIETPGPLGAAVRRRVLARVEEFDAAYSRFRDDSVVTRAAGAAAGGRFVFPDDASALFALYDRLHLATDGAVDPLVGRDLELLGYDRGYSLTPADEATRAEATVGERPTWARDVVRHGSTVVTRRPLVIDVGAAGKGYLVDIVCRLLRGAGVAAFVVDGGGDLRHAGAAPLDVGLEHPSDPTRVIGVARVWNGALCASAVNRRAWGDGMHHVLDARTGEPARDVLATWALAADAATADGLATALFFVDGERLAHEFAFSHVRVLANGRVERSPNFDGELFA